MPGTHSKKNVGAVIFDFGGVLCFHPPEEGYAPLARIFGLTAQAFIPLFWAGRPAYDSGRVDARAYWSEVAAAAGEKFDESTLPSLVRGEVELWNNYDDRVLDWAAQLRASGYRTGILSNLPPVLGEELRATPGFLAPFDSVTFSYELGCVKPQPVIYHEAVRSIGVAPVQTLFLDDRSDNVLGARGIGMHAELFTTWERFVESDLERYGLPAPIARSGIRPDAGLGEPLA